MNLNTVRTIKHVACVVVIILTASPISLWAGDASAVADHGANLHSNEQLVLAAERGYLDDVKRLLNTGAASAKAKDHRGLTSWQAARIYGRKGVADFLATMGADTRKPIPKPEKIIDAMFKEILTNNSPGAAVLVAQNGKILFEKGYGLANIGDRVPVTPQTKFRIGSMTKQFTAAAILKLQEQGKLNLDDKLSKFIPDYPRGDEVTIHHLLTHTSGIHNCTSKPDFLQKVGVHHTPEDWIKSFENDPYDFDPGQKWNYSNSGYVLLAFIFEKVSGEKYEDYMRETFFEPLGMTNTGVCNSSDILDHEACGYTYQAGQVKKALYWDMSNGYGGGNLYSTVGDLYRWNEALFNGKALNQASLEAAFTPVHVSDDNTPRVDGYGCGFMIQKLRGLIEIAHGGGLHGFSSYMLRIPKENLTVAVLLNTFPESPPGMHWGLAEEIAQLYLTDKTEPAPTFVVDKTVSPRAYDAYLGRYVDMLSPSGILLVSKVSDRLFAKYGGHPDFEIFPTSETEFFSKTTDEQITFVKDEKGAIIKAIHRQWGLVLHAPRLPEQPAASGGEAPSQ
jgi:CubicO group peptidase (beta-lactamase class C family)